MVALNFDIPILDSAARAAQLLELLCHRGQLCLASHHPIYNCDCFPSAPFPVARHTHNAIAFTSWLCRLGAPAVFIWQSARGTDIDSSSIGGVVKAIWHRFFLSERCTLVPDVSRNCITYRNRLGSLDAI